MSGDLSKHMHTIVWQALLILSGFSIYMMCNYSQYVSSSLPHPYKGTISHNNYGCNYICRTILCKYFLTIDMCSYEIMCAVVIIITLCNDGPLWCCVTLLACLSCKPHKHHASMVVSVNLLQSSHMNQQKLILPNSCPPYVGKEELVICG